jgi:hypothetical protein
MEEKQNKPQNKNEKKTETEIQPRRSKVCCGASSAGGDGATGWTSESCIGSAS